MADGAIFEERSKGLLYCESIDFEESDCVGQLNATLSSHNEWSTGGRKRIFRRDVEVAIVYEV